jgi:hypothetical protein
MSHLSRKMFGPKELVNPLVELRNTNVVSPTEVHTVIMAEILSIAPWFGKKNRPEMKMRSVVAVLIIVMSATQTFT